MKVKLNSNLWGGILMLVIGLAILVSIPFQIEDVAGSSAIGPRFMPALAAGIILVVSVLNIIRELAAKGDRRMIEIRLDEQVRVLGVAVCMALSYLVSREWNIVVPAIVMGCILLAIMRCKKKLYYITVIATGMVLYLLSRYVIHVRF